MSRPTAASVRAALVVLAASIGLAGCAQKVGVTRVRLSERECLARAMYFESNRSSDAGMIAVGTVVMNRLKSGKYGSSVCDVVGAPRQFAPGVLTRPMVDKGAPRARRMADLVLSGKRHPGVQNAQFFHTAGYKFPYNNMRYVLVAGGNAFYDKTKPPKSWYGGEGRWGPPPAPSERIDGVMVASVEVVDEPEPLAARPPASRRPSEVLVADARSSAQPARSQASYGGIPTHEPAPGTRPREVVVASIDEPRVAQTPSRRVAIREDNGLREEDRWRDQELAEEHGRQPASDGDWRDRRDARVESEPLPVIQPASEPEYRAPAPTRVASRRDVAPRPAPVAAPAPVYRELEPEIVYQQPQPSRSVQVASRAPRQVESRQRPVEANPAALGWVVGPQGQSVGGGEPGYGYR